MSIKILLADDHQIVREGLENMINKQPNLEVIGVAANGRTAVRLANKLSPDVIIMDITMPDLNGMDATRQIIKEDPEAKVIALSVHSDKRIIVNMLEAGVLAYVVKDSAFEDLVKAVNSVIADQVYLSPKVTNVAIKDYVQRLTNPELSSAEDLTLREREVLQLLAEGKSTKQIASTLDVSVKTIESHRQRIMNRLNMHSLAELIKYAIKEGLTSLET